MNKGFRIEIERGLSAEEKALAREYADNWAMKVIENNCSWRAQTKGGWLSYLRRGTFGHWVNGIQTSKSPEELVFRRISKSKRIFGIMRASHLRHLDGSEINTKQCMCPRHLGGTRVTVPNPPEMKQFIEYGEIKG